MQEKLEILYSYHKRRIPSSISGTFFNRHKLQFESGGLQTTHSNVYYFLSSTTDRNEEINRHLGSVNLSPIDIPENSFQTEKDVSFNPSKLDVHCQEKEIMSKAVVKMLEKTSDLSNASVIKNADGLLSKKKMNNSEVEWVGKTKQRLPQNKYKMSY